MIKVTHHREGKNVRVIVRSGPKNDGHMPLAGTFVLDEEDGVRLTEALKGHVGIEVVER